MNRAEYMAELAVMNARPPQADEPTQKFRRGSRVKLSADEMVRMKWYGVADEAIVDYTYRQKFRCGDNKSYSLVMLNETGDPINAISWFDESQLTLVSDDTAAGLAIIERYEYAP
jgi:predicted transposase YdaD